MAEKKKRYSEDDITYFKRDTDKIRSKPQMYIGPTDDSGVFTILREPCDNAVDEARAGRNDLVHIFVNNGVFTVVDAGEGIPVKLHKTAKISTLTHVFTNLQSSGKMKSGAYESAIGTHGVGQKATNALSEFLEVWTYRKDAGGWHYTKFERGIEVVKVKKSNPPKIEGHTFKRGTIVRFKPDDKIFGKAKLSLEQLRTWCEITSYMNAGLNIKLTTQKGTKSWVSKNGIKGYLDKRLTDLKASPLNKEPLAYTSKNIELALSFADVEGEECMFFTNTIRNIDRGFHADALFKALSDSLKPYKGKLEYQPSDLREGLVGILNYKIDAPQFSSQTKEKLVDIRVKDMAYKELLDVFDDYFKKNKSLAKQLVERAAELRKKTADFLKDKKLIKNVKTAQRALAAKLADIVGNKVPVEERELFLVEGDSAGGLCKVARYRDFQAVFSLKGKPLNVMETTKDKVNANKEIAGIFASLGLDLSKANPADSIRYGRIVFLSDPDVDGGHINCLLMTLFWKYLPDLFKQGRIYLVASPEYVTKYKGKFYFGFTKEEVYKKAGTDKLDIRHLKGWGECPAEYLKPLVFDKQERSMFRVLPPVDREGALRFSALMGKDSAYRQVIFGVSNVSEKEALKKCQGRKAKQKAEKQPTKKRKARKNK